MTLMSTYGLWWEAINEIVDKAGTSAADREKLFGGTAAKVYGLSNLASPRHQNDRKG